MHYIEWNSHTVLFEIAPITLTILSDPNRVETTQFPTCSVTFHIFATGEDRNVGTRS